MNNLKQKSIFLFILLIPIFAFTQEANDSVQHLQLFFTGDIMGHGPQIKSAELVRNKSYDYESCFQYVKPIVEEADLAIGNLEVTLPGKPPYTGYPRFRSPDDLAEALRKSGFDLLVTSNNHSNDGGKKGVIHTIDALRTNQFYQTGTFKNERERDLYYPLIAYKNGFKLAFLNYTYDTNGIPTRPPTMVNEIDTTLMNTDLKEAQKLQPDYIIVLMHWGLEYQMKESKKQSRLADWLFKNGADMIIGSHPHVVQPIYEKEFERDGQSQKSLICYSLGNFISNQQKPNTDGGIAVEVHLSKNKNSGKVRVKDYSYLPIWRYVHSDKKGKKTFFALPVAAFEETPFPGMPANDRKAMLKFAKKIRKHLGSEKERKKVPTTYD